MLSYSELELLAVPKGEVLFAIPPNPYTGATSSTNDLAVSQVSRLPSREVGIGLGLHTAFNADEVGMWDPENFETLRKLQDATRNHGEVYLMRDVSLDRLVAVKKMPTTWIRSSHDEFLSLYWYEQEQPWQDIGCTKFLNDHGFEFACELKGVYRDDQSTYVVTSFCDIGDMFSWSLTLVSPGFEREAVVRPIVKQIMKGVMQLHAFSIAHLDLSLENILLTSIAGLGKMSIRLVDFSQAATTRLIHNRIRGKPSYQAPEMHTDEVYDGFLADVFALGVTLYAVIVNDYPWRSTVPGECKCYAFVQRKGFRAYVAKQKLRDRSGKLADCLSEPLIELLEGMLAHSPRDRLTLGGETWEGHARESVWDKPWLISDAGSDQQ